MTDADAVAEDYGEVLVFDSTGFRYIRCSLPWMIII
jgi:hypothetical protein